MTRIERKNEQRKLEKELYYNDYIEDENIFYFEGSYIDAYLVDDEIITGNYW